MRRQDLVLRLLFQRKSTKTEDFFEKEDKTTAFSLFMRLSPCSISRFGVSLPQSKSFLHSYQWDYIWLWIEKVFLDRGLDWTWSCGCRTWGFPIGCDLLLRMKKIQLRKTWRAGIIAQYLSICPVYVRLWVQSPSSQGKEKEKEKEAFWKL